MVLALKNGHLGLPGQKRHLCLPVWPLLTMKLRHGPDWGNLVLGKRIDRNGTKTGLAVLTSLPGNLPGTFPDLPGLRVFSKSVLPSRFSSRNLPGSSRIAVI